MLSLSRYPLLDFQADITSFWILWMVDGHTEQSCCQNVFGTVNLDGWAKTITIITTIAVAILHAGNWILIVNKRLVGKQVNL